MMLEAIETIKRGDEELRIIQDDNPGSPREWDNLGTMTCFHDRYNLGDDNGHFSDPDELIEYVNRDDVIALPLFLYEHGGITMRVGPFYEPWDSGQVGYIYITKEDIRKEYSVKRISPKLLKMVTEVLNGEVETYDQYLRGDVYGYEIVKMTTCECCGAVKEEHVDSCWGFFGDDIKTNGMLFYTGEEWAQGSDAA